MCELQIIKKLGKEKINETDIGEFFKMMCFGSIHNKDAFGVFNNEYIYKNKGAFNASKINKDNLLDDNFVIGHNRFATKSLKINYNKIKNKKYNISLPKNSRWNWSNSFFNNVSNILLQTNSINFQNCVNDEYINNDINSDYDKNKNNHPFKLGDFVLVHNGVILNAKYLNNKYNFNTNISTDSYVILQLFNKFFNESNIKNRVKRISGAIYKTLLKLSGFYSVLLYDKEENNIFYFKDAQTSFYFYKYNDNILCGSTSINNLNCLYPGFKREEINIIDKHIYLITSNLNNTIIDITPKILNKNDLYDILLSDLNYIDKSRIVGKILKDIFGFVPLFDFTFFNQYLKISRNNSDDIKSKINKITKNPKISFGWYIIKPENLKKDFKLKLMKGGKK